MASNVNLSLSEDNSSGTHLSDILTKMKNGLIQPIGHWQNIRNSSI